MIPENIVASLQSKLGSELNKITPLHGGDINQAARIETADGEIFFLKWNTSAANDMFEKEAKGLKLLNNAGAGLHIPVVHVAKDDFLLLEFIPEGGGKAESGRQFGKALAQLHQQTSDQFGLDHNNYIGRLPQSNTFHSNWADFFALERIEPQIKMCVETNKLDSSILRKVQGMYKKFGAIFPTELPALLHGDLWSGNFMFTKSGKTSIYDPAVYFGHREMDLAMTRLFGGFSADFYDGYNEIYPLQGGFDNRISIYNLYPILVHANLFGGSYARQAENIIKRYA